MPDTINGRGSIRPVNTTPATQTPETQLPTARWDGGSGAGAGYGPPRGQVMASTNPTLAQNQPQYTQRTNGAGLQTLVNGASPNPQTGNQWIQDYVSSIPTSGSAPSQNTRYDTAAQFRRAMGINAPVDTGTAILANEPPTPYVPPEQQYAHPQALDTGGQQVQGTPPPTTPATGGPNTATSAAPPNAPQTPTPPPTQEEVWQSLAGVTTPYALQGPPEGMFTAPSTPDTDTLLAIGGDQRRGSINPTLVQNIMNNRGTQAAMDVIRQDLTTASPAAQLANAVRQQQTSQAALPQMYQDLRNVPQLYANPVTRAQLPANIRAAEEARLNGGPDWRTASFGDAIDGNRVTRAVPTSQFQAPTGAAPQQTAQQQQSNMIADFVNSWLPNANNPGARGLSQTYDVNQLNSALGSAPEWQQTMVANRLTGLNPQQLQVALNTSGLTLPQFLAQAVTRLSG